MKTKCSLPLLLVLVSAGTLGAASPRSASTTAAGSSRTLASADAPPARQAQIASLRAEVHALHRDLLNAEQQAERRRREAAKLQIQPPASNPPAPQPASRVDTRSKIDPRLYEAAGQLAQRRRAEELRAELEALRNQIASRRAQLDAKRRLLATLESAR